MNKYCKENITQHDHQKTPSESPATVRDVQSAPDSSLRSTSEHRCYKRDFTTSGSYIAMGSYIAI